MLELVSSLMNFHSDGALISSENILGWVLFVLTGAAILLVLAANSRRIADEQAGAVDESIDKEITSRYKTMFVSLEQYIEFRNKFERKKTGDEKASIDLSSLDYEALERIVATDAFVERAKSLLTKRANDCLLYARISLIACALIAVLFIMWLLFLPSQVRLVTVGGEVTNMAWLYLIVRASGVVALFFFGIVITSTLSRRFFAEWSTLMSRRHALRFGRLAVYLLGNDLKVADLTQLFGWNAVLPTAFDSRDAAPANSQFREIAPNSIQTIIDTVVSKVAEGIKDGKKKEADDVNKAQPKE